MLTLIDFIQCTGSDQFEYTMVVIPLFDFDQAAQVSKELVEKEGL